MKALLLFLSLVFTVNAFSQKIKIENNQLVLGSAVSFKTGTAELLPESEEALKNIKTFLDEKTFISTLRIEGHVTNGNSLQNQTLSEQRAQAVVKWLVKAGTDCGRLLGTGFGDTKPIAAADSPDKASNNRIVFAVAALRGKAIGGLPLDGGGKVAGNACD